MVVGTAYGHSGCSAARLVLRSHLRQAQALGAVRAAAARGQYDTDTPRERGGSLGVIAQWKHRRHGCGTTLAAHRGGWRRAAWTEGEGAARATSADSPACCGASGALDAAAVRAARLMPREVRARGGTGGADGAAGRDRAAAPQHMVGDLHTRTDVLWWCALHCKIPTLQWVGVYIGLDEQYQCTGFRARGLTEECGELGRAAVQLRGHLFCRCTCTTISKSMQVVCISSRHRQWAVRRRLRLRSQNLVQLDFSVFSASAFNLDYSVD